MEPPTEAKIQFSIEQGSVLNFHIDFGKPGRKSGNRYFVVMNCDPKASKILLMLTSTTQIEKKKEFVRKSKISEKTIVAVSPKEYSVFTSESAFNCNDIIPVNKEDLIRKIEENGSVDYPKIPDSILKRLILGVKESPKITEEIKKLI